MGEEREEDKTVGEEMGGAAEDMVCNEWGEAQTEGETRSDRSVKERAKANVQEWEKVNAEAAKVFYHMKEEEEEEKVDDDKKKTHDKK